jgi:hypothetical protein
MKIIAFLFLLNFTNPTVDVSEKELIPLTGMVVEDETGEPLPGAMVRVQGLEKKYYTDFDGNFYIDDLKPGSYEIEVSYISFESKKITEVQIDRTNNTLLVSLK